MTFPVSLKKMIFILEDMAFIKDDKKVYFYKNVPVIPCTFMEIFNHFHNILRLLDVLPSFSFTTSETIGDYYL